MQACPDQALGAKQYYSDAFPIYGTLYYGAPFELRTDKRRFTLLKQSMQTRGIT